MKYRCEAKSVIGFVQQLASNYLPHGYWFYVTGVIPEDKDPREVDCKLVAKYGIDISRQARCRRKLAGRANLHYLRHERFFILLATHGQHAFFAAEGDRVRDVRKTPIQFAGYSLSVTRGHFLVKEDGQELAKPDTKLRVRVQISRDIYRDLKGYFLELAPRRSTEVLSAQLFNVPFEPYAPVRKQLLNLLRLVNQARQSAGLEKLRPTVLRYRREIIRPFAPSAAIAI
jgi:hypothetical protein